MKVHKITCEKHGKIAVYCEECLAEKLSEDVVECPNCGQKMISGDAYREVLKLKKQLQKEYDRKMQRLQKQLEGISEKQAEIIADRVSFYVSKIKKEIENSPRIITEHKLQNMKTIELSYDGRLIPVEEVLKIIKEMEK